MGHVEQAPDEPDATVVIPSSANAPVANFTYLPEKPGIKENILFNATSSYDPDGIIINYEWNFSDGNVTTTTENTIVHSYSLACCSYNVNLTVIDNDGLKDSSSKVITICPIVNGVQTTDLDGDGICEDLNGNSRKDFNDVVLFFNYLEWIADQGLIDCFDFNGNLRLDFNDIIKLFEEL